MLSNRLSGKIALVTGIGSGIGKGCALMFARHGAKVMGCDIHAGTAEETLALARREELAITSLHPCDLTEPRDVGRLIEATVERYAGIDILLNAAAFGAFAWIEESNLHDEVHPTFGVRGVHTKSHWQCCDNPA